MKGRALRWTLFAVLMPALFLLAQCMFDPGMIGPDGKTLSGLAASLDGKKEESPFLVLAYNDLGMHCMNQDFSEFMILPPYNTLHAQVVQKDGEKAHLITSGVDLGYSVPDNTHSADKTNFWTYCLDLLGISLAPDIGLTGNGLSGSMVPSGSGDWVATGIPLTPMNDDLQINPFQLASVVVTGGQGEELARTQAVVPVSWELRCDLCHHGAPDAPVSVLDAHDQLHGTSLYHPGAQTPVLCGGCHAQVELGLPGQPGRASLSQAIHKAHAPRMMDVVDAVPKGVVCYSCHPGVETQCLRDVHSRMQMNCANCHAGGTKDWEVAMLAVGDPSRQPWLTEPRCDSCHSRPGYEYEQPGVLFRNSKGHGGMFCEACHNSTHAITPAQDDPDNVQSVAVQHHPGSIRKCTACHGEQPKGLFVHRLPPQS